MTFRFSRFEIDPAKRELRAGERVLPLQPRVFDLLVYLAQHRERVVPKDELLEAVWPGVIVTDASLQRAISLARSALAESGVADAIRTHARQGYRLCADEAPASRTTSKKDEPAALSPLESARAAFAKGDWEAVIRCLRDIDTLEGLCAEDLQRWAHAAQCAGRPHEAMPLLERAVAAYTARGERRGAAWVAILLAQLRAEWRERVLAKGWLHRAERLLKGEPPCRERGYLDLLVARIALFENDPKTSLERAQLARAAGEQFNDPDLESLGLVHIGEASLYLGRISEGLAAIDEAGASVVASGLSSWAGGLVYCGVIYSSMTRGDWHRAGQWTEQFTRWSEGRGTAGYPGLCRMHRAEVLVVRGRLREAESEIRSTIEMLARHAPWAEGDAWRVLGDILLAKGEYSEARDTYHHASELGWECTFGLALVRYAEGAAPAAARLLARNLATEGWSCRSQRGQALAYYAIVATAAGQPEAAQQAITELERAPDLVSTPALQALLEWARAELAAAKGHPGEAIASFRSAIRTCLSIDAPLRAAQIRCRLADCLLNDGDPDAATMELAASAATFEHAGAEGLLKNCEKLRRLFGRSQSAGGR